VDLRGHEWVAVKEAVFVSHHAIYRHTRLTAFHGEAGAALTEGDVYLPYIGAI
jgi:hypothetical protein